jgi:hypothetical protein
VRQVDADSTGAAIYLVEFLGTTGAVTYSDSFQEQVGVARQRRGRFFPSVQAQIDFCVMPFASLRVN